MKQIALRAETKRNASAAFAGAAKAFACALALGLAGCSDHPLDPIGYGKNVIAGYAKVTANFCTSAPSPAKENLKYVFVLDHSASNQPGFPTPNDIVNTDAQGSRRYGPLVQFVQNVVVDPNSPTSFALIDFNDVAYQVARVQGFDDSKASFLAAVNCDWLGQNANCTPPAVATAPQPADGGFTNYQAALRLTKTLIEDDVKQQAATPAQTPVANRYVVIFVSDGVPRIASGVVQDFATDIQPAVADIMNLRNDPLYADIIAGISVNTAYYANDVESLSAKQLLGQMAAEGQGQFLTFVSGENVLYQRFAPPSRNIRNVLTDVFVDNENAVWWQDGAFYADTDGDGLPDALEAQLGSNPGARDSDGNGVSDLVEYRTKGRACDAAGCAAAGRDSYSVCAGFGPAPDASGRITFASTANDGLNDCEKFLLGGDRTKYNTNGNFVPDFLAFKAGLPISLGTADAAFADPFRDGLINYQKVKNGLPIQISKSELTAFSGRTMLLEQVASATPEVSCYRLTADRVALASASDSLRVMLVQNDAAALDKPFLTSARARVQGGSVTFVQSDFSK